MRAAWFSLVVLATSPALAEPLTTDTASTGDDHAVALAVELGAVGGGGATPGGMRVGGRYLYRMAERDWFDGAVAFTFGRPGVGCGRVPPAGMACDHGVADGFAGDLSLGVRRELGRDPAFVPFVRAAVFARVLRFASDDVTGAAAGGELGAGLRARVSPDLSLIGGATAFAGLARLGNDIGSVGQLGLAITGGAELRMR
ncbi:MAG: hypothetical protein IPL61_31210 [Myxococcales bacterium]|nr:hypothetical protein [Myxococcales bacterium]